MRRIFIALSYAIILHLVILPCLVHSADDDKSTGTVGEERKAEKQTQRQAVSVEQGGALLPSWRFVIEPFFEYDHISGQNVSISGFTIFEAILIGQVQVQKLKRDIFIPGVTLRLGLPFVRSSQGRTSCSPMLLQTSTASDDRSFHTKLDPNAYGSTCASI